MIFVQACLMYIRSFFNIKILTYIGVVGKLTHEWVYSSGITFYAAVSNEQSIKRQVRVRLLCFRPESYAREKRKRGTE